MCLIFSSLMGDACCLFQQAFMFISLRYNGLDATPLFLLQRLGRVRPGSAERLPEDGA